VAKSEIYYEPADPAFIKGKLLWRGPTWINTNWFIVKGLRKHGYEREADKIVERMVEMVQREGFKEYYNPETGEGYRRENFGWSTLVLDLL
jgi:neutral trehalase